MPKNTHPKSSGPPRRRDSQARASARSRRGREHHISIRGELRARPDVRRVARAIIDMELARLEAEAAAERSKEGDADDA